MLLRDRPAFEVLMVRRHENITFGGGALVFPGGRVEAGDHDPAWTDHALGWDETPESERGLRICAIREAYEESGILLARRADGSDSTIDPEAAKARDAVARNERPFLSVLRELGLKLDLGAMALFARWITPAHMPKRFDTWFYAATGADAQLAAADGREAVDAEWIAPGEALRLADEGERKLMFPTRLNLELLQSGGSPEVAIAQARARRIVPVQPRLERRGGEQVVVIPAEAGYGLTEAPPSVLA